MQTHEGLFGWRKSNGLDPITCVAFNTFRYVVRFRMFVFVFCFFGQVRRFNVGCEMAVIIFASVCFARCGICVIFLSRVILKYVTKFDFL